MSDTALAGRPGGRGFRPALAASAAGHALLLAAALLFGPAAPAPPRPGIVEVFPADRFGPVSASNGGAGAPAVRAKGRGERPDAGAGTGERLSTTPPSVVPSFPAAGGTGERRAAEAVPPAAGPAEIPRVVPAVSPGAADHPVRHGSLDPVSVAAATVVPAAVSTPASVPPGKGAAIGMEGRGGSVTGSASAKNAGFGGVPGEGRPAAIGGPAGSGADGRPDGALAKLLREKIRSRIVYPEEAIRRGQEGEVLLRIRVDGRGNPAEIRVARSSGARLLDEAARRGVLGSAPLPAVPGWVEVPVRFFLR